MTKVGNIVSLFYVSSTGHTRVSLLNLDTKGIVGHKHYDKDINRSVLITSLDSYLRTKENNIDISYGDLGENLLIDYNPYELLEGARLKIGEVVLEISQPCTLCRGLSEIDSALPKLLKNDRGIFAKVITSGYIKEGDWIYL
jgi:MOSC domain-containing protein YiiM